MSERIAAAILVVALFAGCEQVHRQRSERALERAEQRKGEGDYTEALRYYEEGLDGTPATAATHFDVALLYDDRLKDPVGALHHFRRYLALAPEGRHAQDARTFMKEDRLKVLTLLSEGGETLSRQDAVRLRNENLELRKQIVDLHAKVESLRKTRSATPLPAGPVAPPPAGSRTYVVEPGDTLAAIARKFYRSSARWKDIQDANYNQLGGTVNLKPGMTLIIPE